MHRRSCWWEIFDTFIRIPTGTPDFGVLHQSVQVTGSKVMKGKGTGRGFSGEPYVPGFSRSPHVNE